MLGFVLNLQEFYEVNNFLSTFIKKKKFKFIMPINSTKYFENYNVNIL